jgi:hypothetical protein
MRPTGSLRTRKPPLRIGQKSDYRYLSTPLRLTELVTFLPIPRPPDVKQPPILFTKLNIRKRLLNCRNWS